MWIGKGTELKGGWDTSHEYVQMLLLRIKDRVECVKGTGQHGGGTPHIANIYLDTAHTFLIM